MDHPPTDLLPPPDAKATLRLGLVGAGLVGLAAGVGVVVDQFAGGGPGPAGTARLLLTAVGVLAAGVAVSRRPDLWATWLLLAVAAALAGVVALPPHWDSGRLLGGIVAAVAGSFAATVALPVAWRPVGATFWLVFHFGGVLAATTLPNPTPWLTQQLMARVFSPYLRATYLTNAYHFYSPEPGPASLLHILVRYELDDPAGGQPTTESEWVVFPTRDQHMKDPLALSYYRHLSLTEAATQSLADAQTVDTFNRTEAQRDRYQVAISGYARPGADGRPEQVVIPTAPAEFESAAGQYRVPDPMASRYLLPSYARHVAHALSGPGRRVVNVKLYRLEHRVVPPEYFAGVGRFTRIDPFHPTTYRAYFLGDYQPDGTLVNPRDPLLYWLIPVLPKPGGAAPGDKNHVDYDDYLSKHAGYEVEWRRP